jgi:hypothetical protein
MQISRQGGAHLAVLRTLCHATASLDAKKGNPFSAVHASLLPRQAPWYALVSLS